MTSCFRGSANIISRLTGEAAPLHWKFKKSKMMNEVRFSKVSFRKLHPVHYPIPFAVLMVFVIAILAGIIAQLLGMPEYRLMFTAPLTLILAFLFKRPKAMLLSTPFRWSSVKYYSLPVAMVAGIPLLTGGYHLDHVGWAVWGNMMGIGIFEEVLIHGIFMGLILEKWGYTKRHLKVAALLGAFIFGLLHLNAILEAPTDPHLIQWKMATVVFATFLSIGFAGLAWQSQSIWGVALVHGLIDVFANVGSPDMLNYIYNSWDWRCSVVSILYCSPMLFWGIWLLNKDLA